MVLTKATVKSMIQEFIKDEDSMTFFINICVERSVDLMKFNQPPPSDASCPDLEALKSRIVLLEQSIDKLRQQITKNDIHLDLVKRHADDTDQYLRRQNLIIDGIILKERDSPIGLRKLIVREIQRLDIDVEDFDIDRVHRVEEPYYDRRVRAKVQPVVIRFTSWYARNEFYGARKQSRFHLRADLTPRRNQLLEYAQNVSRTQRDPDARSSIDFACADRNCSLMFRTADGTIKHFSSYDEFDNLLSSITSSRETEEAYSNKWQPFDDSVSKWFGAASPSDSQSDSRSVSSNISATKPLNMA